MARNIMLNHSIRLYGHFIQQQLPPSNYKEFSRWGIDEQNIYRSEYLQMSSLTQMCTMFTYLYHSAIADRQKWNILCESFGTMLIYQIYEVISDNISMGLGLAINPDYQQKNQLIRYFNTAMVESLDNGIIMLDHQRIKALSKNISLIEQHISLPRNQDLFDKYCAHKNIRLDTIEEPEIWVALYANIASCLDFINQIKQPSARTLIKNSVISRYTAINRLNNAEYTSINQLIQLQIDTMLVIPTLEYCINLWSEVYLDDQALRDDIAENPYLRQYITTATLLVRLLNDVGSILLQLSHQQIAQYFSQLLLESPPLKHEAWYDWFNRVASHPMFFRLHKDVVFNEVNILLYAIEPTMDPSTVIDQMIHNTQHAAQLYQATMALFEQQFGLLSQTSHYRIPLDIASRIVTFHQALYANDYTQPEGEYAV